MEKLKRWQLWLMITVIAVTIYNILPTVFYYTKPLKESVDARKAAEIGISIANRVNSLEEQSVDWVWAFADNLGVNPQSVELEGARFIRVHFATAKEAKRFSRSLERGGLLIPFVPSQLAPAPALSKETEVVVERKVGIHLDPQRIGRFFNYSKKFDDQGAATSAWRSIVIDRVIPIARALSGDSELSKAALAAVGASSSKAKDEALIQISRKLVFMQKTFGVDSSITQSYFATLTQTAKRAGAKLPKNLLSDLQTLSTKLTAKQSSDSSKVLAGQAEAVQSAISLLSNHSSLFAAAHKPLTASSVVEKLEGKQAKGSQIIDLSATSPYFSSLVVDWTNQRLVIQIKPTVLSILSKFPKTEVESATADRLNQLLIDEMARLSRLTNEKIEQEGGQFSLSLSELPGSTSFLTMKLGAVAKEESASLLKVLQTSFHPKSEELSAENFPITAEPGKTGLYVYAPAASTKRVPDTFKKSSYYVIAKGLAAIQNQYKNSKSDAAKLVKADIDQLGEILSNLGFFGFSASEYGFGADHSGDVIFEKDDAFQDLIRATRESFQRKGSQSLAVLELSDVEQRLLTENRIDDNTHEDLLRARDAYLSAQVSLSKQVRQEVPPPIRNVYWDNAKLSFRKYFRGDDRKILKWGLDLSGGKSVRIGLKDKSGRWISDQDDLKEAVNQLYKRVNKMGLSEVSIRTEGDKILLDFPGSQGLSSQELVKAASMSFHVINEKFSTLNRELAVYSNEFLQEVWNEAVVTNRKEIENIQTIAWRHLGGRSDSLEFLPESEAAKVLYENGLRLAGPNAPSPSSAFNDTLSSIALMRGEDFADWEGQTHPLLITFHNFALEGSSLERVLAGYDPQKGNILTFSVASSGVSKEGVKRNFRDDLFNWTNQYAEDRIAGTPRATYSQGRGWRMGVVLNGSVISAPALNSPIRDHAMITGHFTQREINQLVADLKAGSLTFTPKILSESNISPELGKAERNSGIFAAAIGTVLVIIAMIVYYRFAGLVASVAVLFNLAILWGVLQNLDAALTLPGIAAIILTIGMAVDANVLVYERVREELNAGKRLASALALGYKKAFSAIVDSNLTTIIAALILLQFDSGPIKGFALTLIVGIVSSMFTALFMTRAFFSQWVQNPARKTLTMMRFLTTPNFNFLKWAKPAILASAVVVILGAGAFWKEGARVLGMDFTGGWALTVNVEPQSDINPREAALHALVAKGANPSHVQVRQLSSASQLRIQLSTNLEQKGQPFFGLPQEIDPAGQSVAYASNPRILWVVDALESGHVKLTQDSLNTISENWNQTSGQLSETMRDQAVVGLGLAMLAILAYLWFRFEFKYGIAAIIGLVHDVVMTFALIGLLSFLGVAIEIDLQTIAAIMTIIGYSLNDTIIIFDRIREDLRLMRKEPIRNVITHALNATLSRTVMTSGTTLLVLLALVTLGGKSIFGFSLVMAIGVVVGTLSSLFVASPLLIFFHFREARSSEVVES